MFTYKSNKKEKELIFLVQVILDRSNIIDYRGASPFAEEQLKTRIMTF